MARPVDDFEEVVLSRPPAEQLVVVLQPTPLGRGGEGSVFAPTHRDPLVGDVVVKRYHDEVLARPDAPDRAEKIAVMLANPPASTSLCWPTHVASDVTGRFVGFAMPRVDATHALTWGQLANAADRKRLAPSFSVRYALRSCANLAAAVAAAHAVGAVIGDLNESNLLVADDASVTVIDCDSAQVSSGARTWRCWVGKPEYAAAELVGTSFKDTDRTPASDVFALGVLTFQMLCGGAHPFDGVPTDLDADPPSTPERIRAGLCPYLGAGGGVLAPAPRVPAAALPSRLAPLLAAALLSPPAARPSARGFHDALVELDAHLVECPTNPAHAYDRRDVTCGWCAHARGTGTDPFAGATPAQRPLPPVAFNPSPSVAPPLAPASFTAAQPPPAAQAPGLPSTHQPAAHSPTHAAAQPPGQAAQQPATQPVAQPAAPTAATWFDLAVRHPVLVANHVLERIPGRDRFGPCWPHTAAAPPLAPPAQVALRAGVCLAGVAALVALVVLGTPRLVTSLLPTLPVLATAATLLCLAGLLLGAGGYLVVAGRWRARRLGRRFEFGDVWRLWVTASFWALATLVAPLVLAALAVASALRSLAQRW